MTAVVSDLVGRHDSELTPRLDDYRLGEDEVWLLLHPHRLDGPDRQLLATGLDEQFQGIRDRLKVEIPVDEESTHRYPG